jgi:hypothetical protein
VEAQRRHGREQGELHRVTTLSSDLQPGSLERLGTVDIYGFVVVGSLVTAEFEVAWVGAVAT